MEKPQIYWWEKVNLVDHKGQKALQIGSRRRRWFQMYKVHHWGRSVIYGEYPILDQSVLVQTDFCTHQFISNSLHNSLHTTHKFVI